MGASPISTKERHVELRIWDVAPRKQYLKREGMDSTTGLKWR